MAFDSADAEATYAAAHTAWKYGIQLDASGGQPILSCGSRQEAWPDSNLTREIAALLRSPLPKHAEVPFSTRLDDAERALLRQMGFQNDPVLRGKTFRVWLTHDIDQLHVSYQLATHTLKHLRHGRWRDAVAEIADWLRKRTAGQDPYFNIHDVLALEKQYGVPSTFFFLQQTPIGSVVSLANFSNRYGLYDIDDPPITALIREMAENGIEIGVHGSFESVSKSGLLAKEVAHLAHITGKGIALSRQHFLNYEPWDTALVHETVGIQLDSSVGFTHGVGPRTHSVFPMLPRSSKDGRLVPILEVPPIIMDVCIPEMQCEQIVDRVVAECAARGGILTAIWHNVSFAAGVPQGRARAYRHLIETCQHLGAEFVTGADLLRLMPPPSRFS